MRYSTMPCDFSRATGIFRAKHDPDVVLGHGQMNIIKAKQLTAGHHTQCHTEAVQLLFCNATKI